MGAVTEATPMLSGGWGYPAWKAAAERACLVQDGMEVVRLRPAIVYGAGSQLWVARLAERIRSGRWGDFGRAGDGACNPVHVLDVVAAIRLALTRPGIGGSVYNVSGGETLTWNEWFGRMAEAAGSAPLRPVSPAMLWTRCLAALPVKALARVRPGFGGQWLLGAPARSEMALFARKATYPIVAARIGLGWEPRIGIAEGLANCARWLKQRSEGRCEAAEVREGGDRVPGRAVRDVGAVHVRDRSGARGGALGSVAGQAPQRHPERPHAVRCGGRESGGTR